MSNVISSLEVDLKLKSASFSRDMKNAAKNSQDFGKTAKESAEEAKGSLMLLGDTIGITIPRHLQTVIASIPGVGTALSAAFNSVAVLAFIDIVVKIIEKVQEFRKAAQEAAGAFTKFLKDAATGAVTSQAAITELRAKFVGLNQGPIAEMEFRLAHVNELLGDLKLNEGLDKSIAEASKGLHSSLLEFGNTAQKDFDDFIQKMWSTASTVPERAALVVDKIQELQAKLAQDKNLGGQSGANAVIGDEKELQALQVILKQLDDFASQAAEKRKNDVKALSNAQAEASKKQQDNLDKELLAVIHLEDEYRKIPLQRRSAPTLPTEVDASGVQSQRQNPFNAGFDKQIAEDNQKTLDDAKKVYDSTRTSADTYAQTVADLNDLLGKGVISQNTYDRAVKQAKDTLDGTSKAWGKFGEEIGSTISQAALMGRSWGDALKSILADLAQVIIKLTLMKSLSSTTGKGGGGILGSILGGFAGGFATGGQIPAGQWGIAGENGPEPVFGGITGATVFPSMPSGGSSNSVQVIYQIDARGSSITEAQFKRSLKESEDRTVTRAIATQRTVAQRH
ncbi:MAG: hypothetical protein ACRD3W_28405 [Terriglobales bacterium]